MSPKLDPKVTHSYKRSWKNGRQECCDGYDREMG